jgi:hypothetical protein
MQPTRPTFSETVIKTIIVHTVTYFIMGVVAFTLLDYSSLYSGAGVSGFLRPTSDRLVMAGPLFQPLRGLLFGAILYLLREPFFHRRNGWLTLWATLVVIGIFGTSVAGPGSLEGVVYTTVPLSFHLKNLPEVIIQTFLFSGMISYWINHPEKKWLNWVLGVVFFLVLLFPALGVLLG